MRQHAVSKFPRDKRDAEVSAMSSPEELTFVVGRWLWPFIVVLYVGRRLGFWPIPSREQRSTALNH